MLGNLTETQQPHFQGAVKPIDSTELVQSEPTAFRTEHVKRTEQDQRNAAGEKSSRLGSGFSSLPPVIPGGLFCGILQNSCFLTSSLPPCRKKLFAILALKMLLKSPVFSKTPQRRSALGERAEYTGSISAIGRYFTMLGKTN